MYKITQTNTGYMPSNTTVYPTAVQDWDECMIARFFLEEAKKPAAIRSTACMISCPCRRCNPSCF